MEIKILEGFLNKNGHIKPSTPPYIKNIYYKRKLYSINHYIIPQGVIYSAKSKTRFHCTICGFSWDAVVNNILNGQGCQSCNGVTPYTKETFEAKLKIIHPNISLTGKYSNVGTPTEFVCTIHDHSYVVKPSNLLSGFGCKLCCYDRKRQSENTFNTRCKVLHPNLDIVGKYKGTAERVSVVCSKDNYKWEPFAYALLSGQGCPVCAGNKTKTHNEFLEQVNIIHKNICIKGIYFSSSTKIDCECTCGYGFSSTPNSLLQGHGCPRCGYQDKDALYFWKDHNGYYKIGVTRWSLYDSRAKYVARKRGTTVQDFTIV